MSSPQKSDALWPALIWLAGSFITIATNWLTDKSWFNIWLVSYAWLTFVTSLVAVSMFWLDKRAAIKNRRRTPEKRLFTIAAIGGWPGAVVGQQWFRHKSQKFSFRTVLWAIVIGHMLLVAVAVYFNFVT